MDLLVVRTGRLLIRFSRTLVLFFFPNSGTSGYRLKLCSHWTNLGRAVQVWCSYYPTQSHLLFKKKTNKQTKKQSDCVTVSAEAEADWSKIPEMNRTAGRGEKSNHVHWLMRLAECELAKKSTVAKNEHVTQIKGFRKQTNGIISFGIWCKRT